MTDKTPATEAADGMLAAQQQGYAKGHADALRGAAERVRALPGAGLGSSNPDYITTVPGAVMRDAALAAILDGAPEAAGGRLDALAAQPHNHEFLTPEGWPNGDRHDCVPCIVRRLRREQDRLAVARLAATPAEETT